MCPEALPLVSFEAGSAEVPGKQLTPSPQAGGNTGRMHCWFWNTRRVSCCDSIRNKFIAHCVLFLITFPAVEILGFISSLSDCAEGDSFSGCRFLHSVFNHVTKRQGRIAVTLYFLYWKFAAFHSKTSLGKCVSLGSVAYCMVLTAM